MKDVFNNPSSRNPERRSGFTFGNVRSQDFGIYLMDVKTFGTPSRDYTYQTVPGRNGDLVLDNGRWKNLTVKYKCAIVRGFSDRFTEFFAAILQQDGYQRLHDTIRPDVFRLASISDAIEPTAKGKGSAGTFELTFQCKPQRFLVTGEKKHSFQAAAQLENKCKFPSLPLITVYGSGAGILTIGSTTVEVKKLEDSLILDCDTMNAYRAVGEGATENRNSDINAPEFPQLDPGKNSIAWSGGITSVDIVPRWWTL